MNMIEEGSVIEALLRPRSVAIIGVSAKPKTAGHVALGNLTLNKFSGDIYLVGRSGGSIEGRAVLASVDDLPLNIDLAIFTLPASSVLDAVKACGRRKLKAAVVFAAGFAEMGDRAAQDQLTRAAREGGVALLGPNCLGYTNYIDGLQFSFTAATVVTKADLSRDPATAIISQSGGLMAHVARGLQARDLPVSYTISTGNEAVLGVADFIDYMIDDEKTRSIIAYIEEGRQPQRLLTSLRRASEAGKPVIVMHPGKSDHAHSALTSHTGALAGDHAVMRTLLSDAGALVVETLDEMVDVAELVARYPRLPVKGPGVVTFSGAMVAIAHDFCQSTGLDIPSLSEATVAALKPQLPAYAHTANPLDLTTQPVFQPELLYIGPKALLDDPNTGSLVLAIMPGGPEIQRKYVEGLWAAMQGCVKPVLLSFMCDRMPLAAETVALARDKRLIVSRSSDRSIRALACVTRYARAQERKKRVGRVDSKPLSVDLPALGHGLQPEWLCKKLLTAIGIATPNGVLAKSLAEAEQIAANIGYPVAMKAQAAALAHKTEADAVRLNLTDGSAVARAWKELQDNVRQARPDIVLDGVLVERMADKGVELVIGGRRDPQWGPVILVGLGGIWVEALGDVRLMPADLAEELIIDELRQLRAAKLLQGFRGAPAADIGAVARVARLIGQLMQEHEEILEIDLNPVFVHAQGRGVTVADALIVTR
ncbi:MAG: acetate--CoA ligase family protein [Burkholderiales bacterium]